jgi:hypothetical protein
MHYIVGTRICVTANVATQFKGPRSVSAKPVRTINRSTPFEPGEPYSLYNIVYNKDDTDYKYVFINENTEQLLELKFKSTKEADKCISNALGQQLPDYDKFYSKWSG